MLSIYSVIAIRSEEALLMAGAHVTSHSAFSIRDATHFQLTIPLKNVSRPCGGFFSANMEGSRRYRALVNPRRACAERVTVVVSCVCMYVCMSVRTRYSGSTHS